MFQGRIDRGLPSLIEVSESPVVSSVRHLVDEYRRTGNQRFFDDVGAMTSRLRHENGVLHRSFEGYLKSLSFGEERAEIFRDYGVLVLDAAGSFNQSQMRDIRSVLSSTTRGVAENAAYAIFADTTSKGDSGKNLQWGGVVAEYYRGGGSMRLLVDSSDLTKGIIGHEFAHGIHFKLLDEKLFAQFAEIGGWSVKAKGGSISPTALKSSVYSFSDEEWQGSKKASEFARVYGMKNPIEDFATLYEGWTSDSSGIWAKAVAAKNSGNDTLYRKLKFMEEHVFTMKHKTPSGSEVSQTRYYLKTSLEGPSREVVLIQADAKSTGSFTPQGMLMWLRHMELEEMRRRLDEETRKARKNEN